MRLAPLAVLVACSHDTDRTSDTGVAVDTDTGPEVCSIASPAVTVGTGDFTLVPLSDGDEVTMVHGTQGGWHVWAGASLTGTSHVMDVASTLTTVLDGATIGDSHLLLDLTEMLGYGSYEPETCSGTFWHQTALLALGGNFLPFADICALEGQQVTLTLAVTSFEPPAPDTSDTGAATGDTAAVGDTGHPLADLVPLGTGSDSATIVVHIDPDDRAYCQAI